MSAAASEFNNKLAKIARLKKMLDDYEVLSKPVKDELGQLKIEVAAHMVASSSRRTDPVDGFYLVRKDGQEKKELVDRGAAIAWILENDYNLADFTSLDESKVIERAENYFQDTGEVLEFVRVTKSPDTIAITREKIK